MFSTEIGIVEKKIFYLTYFKAKWLQKRETGQI
jgi:hypothetical protein